jgi:phosphohistidine swiveling domain-containing protein
MAATRRAVLLPTEGTEATRSSQVRGGKGANLAEMVDLGLPVPPFFTIPTAICRAYMEHGRLPNRFDWHLERGIAELEKATGRQFGCVDNPLLVSVRSGAPVSMPGMMDTVLNVGMTSDTLDALRTLGGEKFADDLYGRFCEHYGIGDEPVYLGPAQSKLLPGSVKSMLGRIALQGAGNDPHLPLISKHLLLNKFYNTEIIESKNDHHLSLPEKESYHKFEPLDFGNDLQGLQIGTMGTGRVNKALLLGVTLGRKEEPGPWEQVESAIIEVLESWNSERAQAYRKAHGITDWIGTAVNVQAMVFGNLDDNSGTGVAFSANHSTGEAGMFGEWLQRAQGEDIVSGSHTPLPISALQTKMPAVYTELKGYVEMLSTQVGGVAEVEFTVEAGKLYVLQYRRAKFSPLAAATMAVRAQWAKQISREEAVESLSAEQIRKLKSASFSPKDTEQAMKDSLVAEGLPASPGAAVGMAVYSSQEAQEAAAKGIDVVLLRPDTSPDDLLGMLAAKAIVTGEGGMTCHAAMVASAEGIPAVVGVGEIPASGGYLSVDATNGRIFRGKLPLNGVQRTKEVNIFLKWAARAKPKPVLDFSLLDQRFCMNQVLNDYYLAKRMAEASSGSSLEREASELWRRIRSETAVLMGTYLTVALSGELRHFYDSSCDNPLPETQEKAQELFAKYVDRVGSDRYRSQMSGVEHLSRVGLADQIRFAQLAADIFADPGWKGSIGGKPWAEIALALLAYLDGSWDFVTFVDHAFDLRHHGGVLFNKHVMVSAETVERKYTDTGEVDDALVKQLGIKKKAESVRDLFNGLGNFVIGKSPASRIAAFGSEVEAVWDKGEQLGLW